MFQYAVESHKTSVGESNKTHPGTVVPPGSNGRDGGGNKAVQVLPCKRPCKRVSERAGRNMSEHRASLEKGNANADPVETGGRLLLQGKRATRAPCRFAGVLVMACWQQESWRNTGSPVRWGGSPQPLARESGGESSRVAERPVVVRRRLIPAEPRGLSSRAMNKGRKARRLTWV